MVKIFSYLRHTTSEPWKEIPLEREAGGICDDEHPIELESP